jgi:HEAT repeat protein
MTATDAERLWEELRHRDADGKRAWVERLARDGSLESIDLLLAALEHDSWYLRDTATRAIGSLGDAVVDPLCGLLHSGLWYTRAAAATALGLTALPVAASPLTVMLRDANRTVRDAARDALLALARQELAAHAVATAFSELPERAQRFALDGLAERDPAVAQGVERLMADPARRAAAETDSASPRLPRAVNDDAPDLLWEDVVGRRRESRG